MKFKLTFFLFFVYFSFSFSQSKLDKNFSLAEAYFEDNEFKNALKHYLLITETSNIGITKDDLAFKMAICYYNLKEKDKAISYFEKYIQLTETDKNYEAHFLLGQLYQHKLKLQDALEQFHIFKTFVNSDTITEPSIIANVLSILNKRIENCNYGITIFANPRDIIIENLGDSINTPYSEYAPVITSDESKLAFTRRSPESSGGKLSPDGDYYEDIYISIIKEGAVMKQIHADTSRVGFINVLRGFKLSKPLPLPMVNTSTYEGAIQFSHDGKKLFVYKKNNVFESKLLNDEWQKPEEIKELKNVLNPLAYEPSVSVSYDGKKIFFSSDREGGFGGLDLYSSSRREDGSWSVPYNLGPVINTHANEDSPYIDPDGSTLYFSSKGHSSMGGYDVFKTVLKFDQFSSPQNMGYPINSPDDDIFFMMTPKYNRGYYASDKAGGKGKMDIYRITFANERSTFAEVKGYVLKGDTLVPAKSRIKLIDHITNKEISSVESDSISGSYLLLIGHEKHYKMVVETEDFVPYSKDVAVPTQKDFFQYYQEIHHVYLKDKLGNRIGQMITMYSSYDDSSSQVDFVTTADFKNANQQDFISRLPEKKLMNELSKNNEVISAYNKSENKQKYLYDLLSGMNEDDLKALLNDDPELLAAIKNAKKSKGNVVADIKFYISEDSLVALMKDDPTLKFKFPAKAKVSFFDVKKAKNKYSFLDPDYYVLSESGIEYFNTNDKKPLYYSTNVPTSDLKNLLTLNDTSKIPSILILFEFKGNEINDNSKIALNSFAEFMRNNPKFKFYIIGHTDVKGSDAYNQRLSLKRASAVYNYLVKTGGVKPNRFIVKGVGKSKPIAPNENPDGTDNEEGRKLNRRVEFKLISNK